MNKPLISVVIPAYNEEKYLPSCLSSLKNQTFKDFELIVVDNNSTDKTAQIARKFGAKVVHESKQGIVYARGKGFREAQGEIIARTDADCVVPPDWLKFIWEAFQNHPKTVALMGSFDTPNKKIPSKIFRLYSSLIFVTLGKLFVGHTLLIGSNMALRKSAWLKVKEDVHLNENFVLEDVDLACHLSKTGDILFVSHLLVPLSLRAVTENPKGGLNKYLKEYPKRYIRTMIVHNPRFRHLHLKKPDLRKYLPSSKFIKLFREQKRKIKMGI